MRWGVLVGSILIVVLLGAGTAACTQAPLAPGTTACVGMESSVCQSLLGTEQARNRTLAPTAFRIRCTVALCTTLEGTAEIVIVWSDGSVGTTTKSWAGGLK